MTNKDTVAIARHFKRQLALVRHFQSMLQSVSPETTTVTLIKDFAEMLAVSSPAFNKEAWLKSIKV